MSLTFEKAAVVYFSCTGKTEQLAQTAARALKSMKSEDAVDVFEIEPVEPYTPSELDWTDEEARSTIECHDLKSRPEIKTVVSANTYRLVFKPENYDTVVIAYPVWWAYAPKIVYTFVENYDLTDKTVIPLCTSDGSGIGNSGKELEKCDTNAKWIRGKLFDTDVEEDVIRNFFESIQ